VPKIPCAKMSPCRKVLVLKRPWRQNVHLPVRPQGRNMHMPKCPSDEMSVPKCLLSKFQVPKWGEAHSFVKESVLRVQSWEKFQNSSSLFLGFVAKSILPYQGLLQATSVLTLQHKLSIQEPCVVLGLKSMIWSLWTLCSSTVKVWCSFYR
jgi:hypothetical protein